MNDNKKPMAHEEAEKTNAVESYLLNDLTEEQRSRFEEHYFECPACADAVMAGQVFIQGIRPVNPWWKRLAARLSDPVAVPAWGMWAQGGAVVAAFALVAVQYFVVAASPNTPILAKEIEKGQGEDNTYELATPSATVEVVPFEKAPFPFYRMTIDRDQNEIVTQILPGNAQRPAGRLSVQVAAKVLGQGSFTVILAGLEKVNDANPKPLGTYRFSIAH
jgi:hypothetical protein